MRNRRFRWWRVRLLALLALTGVLIAPSWAVLRVHGPIFTRDRARAWRLIEADLRVERFVDLRFRAVVFVTNRDVDEALGTGPRDESGRDGRLADSLHPSAVHSCPQWRTTS
jgi:hypothetical protein